MDKKSRIILAIVGVILFIISSACICSTKEIIPGSDLKTFSIIMTSIVGFTVNAFYYYAP